MLFGAGSVGAARRQLSPTIPLITSVGTVRAIASVADVPQADDDLVGLGDRDLNVPEGTGVGGTPAHIHSKGAQNGNTAPPFLFLHHPWDQQ